MLLQQDASKHKGLGGKAFHLSSNCLDSQKRSVALKIVLQLISPYRLSINHKVSSQVQS